VFACGDANTADFNLRVSQIGGPAICGYLGGIPRQIVTNDDIVSAKSLVTGNIYEIDLHNWTEGGECIVSGEAPCGVGTVANFTYERIFTVGEPATPSEMLGALAETILTVNLQSGISNALDSKLDSALDDTNEKNDGAALNSMYAFRNNVNAQRGKKLSESQADQLIEGANGIISALDEFTPLSE
jgi:hypothetical protein